MLSTSENEIQQFLTSSREKEEQSLSEYPVTLRNTGNGKVVAEGQTYDIRDLLSRLGFRWRASTKIWMYDATQPISAYNSPSQAVQPKQEVSVIVIRQGKSFTSKNGEMKYISTIDIKNKVLYEFAIKKDTRVRTYDILKVFYNDSKDNEWNLDKFGTHKIDAEMIAHLTHTSDLIPRKTLSKLKFSVTGHWAVDTILKPKIADGTFYIGYFVTKEGAKITESMFNNKIVFTPAFNKLQPIGGHFEMSGKVEVVRREVNGAWVDVPRVDTITNLKLVNYDLADLERVTVKHLKDKEYQKLLDWVRSQIKGGNLVTAVSVSEQFPNYDIEAAALLLQQVIMKKEWDKRYLDLLKSVTTDKICWTDNSFIIHSDSGFYIWETPEEGNATYVFKYNGEVSELWTKISATNKLEIIQSKELQQALGFQGRVIHPKDEEFIIRWWNDILQLINKPPVSDLGGLIDV